MLLKKLREGEEQITIGKSKESRW